MNWKRITVWLAVYARYASKYMKTEQTMFSPFLLVKDMHLFDTKEEMVSTTLLPGFVSRIHRASFLVRFKVYTFSHLARLFVYLVFVCSVFNPTLRSGLVK